MERLSEHRLVCVIAMTEFENLKVGDVVTRMLGGTIPMRLSVSAITDRIITCSAWQFDKASGAEIDEELGLGPLPLMTGSYLDPSKRFLQNDLLPEPRPDLSVSPASVPTRPARR